MALKHKLVSTIPDDAAAAAAGQVVPSNWNDDHSTDASDTQVLFSDSGEVKGDAGLTYQKSAKALGLSGPLTVTPLADAAAGTFRRFSSSQTSALLQLQTEANAALAAFDKDGKLTTPAVNLGVAGTTTGALTLSGSTSGTVTVQTAAAAGTYTLTLPTDDGDAGQTLSSNGSGTLSWVTRLKSDPTGVTGADAITNVMSLTQAEYNAITPDAATLYVIT